MADPAPASPEKTPATPSVLSIEPPLSPPRVPHIQTVAATPRVGHGEEFNDSRSPITPPINPDSDSPPRSLTPRKSSLRGAHEHHGSPTKSPSSPPLRHSPSTPNANTGGFSLSPPITASSERRSSTSTASSTSTYRVRRKPVPSDDGASFTGYERNLSVTSFSADSPFGPRRPSASSSSAASQRRRPSDTSLNTSPAKQSLALPHSPSASMQRRASAGSFGERPSTAPAVSPGRSFKSLAPAAPITQLPQQGDIQRSGSTLSKASARSRSRIASNASRPGTATDRASTPSQLASAAPGRTTPTPSRPATAPAEGPSPGAFSRKETVMVDGQAFVFGGKDEPDSAVESSTAEGKHGSTAAVKTSSSATPSQRAIVGKVVDLSSLTQDKARAAAAFANGRKLSNGSVQDRQYAVTAPEINAWQRLEQSTTDTSYTVPRRIHTPFKRSIGRAESSDGIANRPQLHATLLSKRPGTASSTSPALPFRKVPFKRQSAQRGGSISSTQPSLSADSDATASKGSYAIEPPSYSGLEEAASLSVFTEGGDMIRFGQIFEDRRTLVCFLRHWFCPMCQEFAHSMQKIDPLPLQRANLGLVVVGQGHPHVIAAYKKVTGVPDWIRMYADPTRKIYKALGMTLKTNDPGPQCAKPDYVQMSMLKGTLKAVRNGLFEMPLRTPGDLKLLGGEFIFGPGIQCSFTHRMVTTRGHLDLPRVLAQAGCDMSLQSARAIGEESSRPEDTRSVDRVRARRSLGRTVKQIARNFEAERNKSIAVRPASRASTLRSFGQDIPAVPKLPAAAAFESSRVLAKSVSQPQGLSNVATSRLQPRAAKAVPLEEQEENSEGEDEELFGVRPRKGQAMSLSDAIRMGPPAEEDNLNRFQTKQRQTLADGPLHSARKISAERASQRSHAGSGSRKQSEEDVDPKKSLTLSPTMSTSGFSHTQTRKRGLLDVAFQGIRKTTSTPDLAQAPSPRASVSSNDVRPVASVNGSPLVGSDADSVKARTHRMEGVAVPDTKAGEVTEPNGEAAPVRGSPSSAQQPAPALDTTSVDSTPARSGGIPLSVFQRQIMSKGKAAASGSSARNVTGTSDLSTSSPRLDSQPTQDDDGLVATTSAQETTSSVAGHADPGMNNARRLSEQANMQGDALDGLGLRSAAEARRDSLNKSLPSLPPSVATSPAMPAPSDQVTQRAKTPTNTNTAVVRQSVSPRTQEKYYFGAMALAGNGGGGSFLDDLDVVDGFRRQSTASTSTSQSTGRQEKLYPAGEDIYPRESFDSWAETEAADSDSDMEHDSGWVRRPSSSRTSGITVRSPGAFVGNGNGTHGMNDYRPSMDSTYSRDSMQTDDYRDSASYGRPSYDGTERSYSDGEDDDRSRSGDYSDEEYERRRRYDDQGRPSEEDSRSDYTASPDERDPARDVYKSKSPVDKSAGKGSLARNAFVPQTRMTNGYIHPRTLDTFDEEDEEEDEVGRSDEDEDAAATVSHGDFASGGRLERDHGARTPIASS